MATDEGENMRRKRGMSKGFWRNIFSDLNSFDSSKYNENTQHFQTNQVCNYTAPLWRN